MQSEFLFCLYRAGLQTAVKVEAAHMAGQWGFSYSRPGFMTFRKRDKRAVTLDEIARLGSWVTPLCWGLSLGRMDDKGSVDWSKIAARLLEFAPGPLWLWDVPRLV